MKTKVLVISPHPDDETLGAGGTILKYKHLGHEVYWLNVTNMKEEYGWQEEQIQTRKKEIENVAAEYQFDDFFDLGLKPAGLDSYPLKDVVEKISEVLAKVKTEIVILPFKNDMHSDHRIVFESAYACMKVFRCPSIKRVLVMEVLSETYPSPCHENFAANYFVDISDYMEKKIEIMKIYKSEIQKHPFPRSTECIKALATLRGSEAGCQYAEGFMLLKEIA